MPNDTIDMTETTMMPNDNEPTPFTALVRRAPKDVVLMPVMDVKLAQQRMEQLQEFCANYLQESKDGGTDGGDYGIIPGAGKKKVLFKSGAEKLCDVYGLADRYTVISKVEDFEQGLFDYTIQCELHRKTDEMFVGSALSSCSSYESKYRWRESQRTCPACGAAAIIKGKEEYGGGFLCWAKKGGCGAKFADGDPAILDQKAGRIENPDIIDQKNTVLKMAQKRAKVSAVIGATRTSGIFTPDLEDYELHDDVKAAPTEGIAKNERVEPAEGTVLPERTETHAEKIARVKAEAAAARTKVKLDPPISQTIAPEPPVESEPVTATKTAPDGAVFVTGINVKSGQPTMKDGVTKPAWGPLYVITFSGKVTATDGSVVTSATTFSESVATEAEVAREEKKAVKPIVEQSKSKKGNFGLTGFAE